jgi:hypothetical protein
VELTLKEILLIVIPILAGLGGIITVLGKWVVKTVLKSNDLMYKEVILNKIDIIAMDDVLEAILKTYYIEGKKAKKDELLKRYSALGKLDRM